jgi:hypothetical protein
MPQRSSFGAIVFLAPPLGDGGFAVAWIQVGDEQPVDRHLLSQRFNEIGEPVGEATEIFVGYGYPDYISSARSSSGDYFLAWQYSSVGYVQRFDGTAAPVGSALQLPSGLAEIAISVDDLIFAVRGRPSTR